jgi:hydrogenase-4 component B
LGIFAGNVMNVLAKTAGSTAALSGYMPAFQSGGGVFRLTSGFSTISMPLVFGALVAAIIAAVIIVRLAAPGRIAKIGRTWDCGSDLGPRMEITATGFSRSIVLIFKGILKPSKQLTTEYRDADVRYFTRSSSVQLGVADIYASYIYNPLRRAVTKIADKVKKVQGGNVSAYVSYIFIALIVCLCLLVAR